MSYRKLPDDHPYVRCFTASVLDFGGKCCVKWRLFSSEKFDQDFASFAEADAFARTLVRGPHIVTDFDCAGSTFEDLTEYWGTVAARVSHGRQ